MHGHPHSVTVFLAGGHFKMTMPDGKTLVSTVPKGKAVWEEAGPHSPETSSDESFEAVHVEPKRSPRKGDKAQ